MRLRRISVVRLRRTWAWLGILALGFVLLAGGAAGAQVNTVDLSGQVLDPQGLAVPGAKVAVRNLATGATRSAETDQTGRYRIVGLPPGRYELTVDGGKGLAKMVNPELVLTIGQSAEFDAHLQLQSGAETITVSEATELIETRRTSVAETVDQRRIANLPINGRNYINFTLTTSQAARSSAPSIGAAPDSGINMSGQRGRSNQVSVDGADATDNSVNGVRATVSQEAVQEFQIIVSNYMPEFGRATGGVINIVTKGGSNDFHGNVFGFLRHKSIQARNPFSVSVDPATGALIPVKQAFTRVQTGATFGGALKKDKTFYFFSYETTRRQETGFSNIGANNFGLVDLGVPGFPSCTPPLLFCVTPAQRNFIQAMLGSGNPALVGLGRSYAALAGSSSSVALGGLDPGLIATGGLSPGPFFPLPCTPPNCTTGSAFRVVLPPSFVTLNSIRGNFPFSEGTSLWSARLDHQWNPQNSSFLRVSVSPSLITGIEVNAQNQNAGTNSASRTSQQESRDFATVFQHVTSITNHVFNEFRFQFARRSVHYGFSQLPGPNPAILPGAQVAGDILGFASFGREPFSTVDRIERRYQGTDNISWTIGRHSFKAGVDINWLQIRSHTNQVFELDFGGLYRFGGLTASEVSGGRIPDCLAPVSPCPAGSAVPGFNAAQTYGLGLPGSFLQGVGSSGRPFDNKAFAGFIQDSWKIHPRLTMNYGVRYDVELTPIFTPKSQINSAAEAALGLIEGIPRDYNNFAPRLALAWDPWGDGKTVVRAGYGLFYDHPLLAIPFLSSTADGAQSVQLTIAPGAPSALALTPFNATSVLNASSIFQGILNQGVFTTLGYQANGNLQRFDPFLANSFFINQNFLQPGTSLPLVVLPFTFPVARTFVYASAQQANLTIERQFAKDYKLSIGYTYLHGVHLNRPRNINPPRVDIIIANADIAVRSGLVTSGTNPQGIIVPSAPSGPPTTCPAGLIPPGGFAMNTPGGGSVIVAAPGVLATGFALPNCGGVPLGPIGTAAVFNFFRNSGPNPSFSIFFPGGFAQLQGLAGAAGFPTGPMGVPIPYSDISQQESSGTSVYHGMTVAFSKRFARHFEFLSSYTFSHTIDDSTDLQSPLNPQDSRFARRERGNSTFDQRHRWVTSAVFESPYHRTDDGFWRKFLADFTVAPIIELASGRPFNILTGVDNNFDGPTHDRPSVVPVGTPGSVTSPFIPGVAFATSSVCDGVTPAPSVPSPPFGCTGNLGRNAFTRPGFFAWDMRLSRKIHFTERVNLEIIADAFNLFNRNNIADVNPLCDPGAGNCFAGQPTASFDQRQFQFALKINW